MMVATFDMKVMRCLAGAARSDARTPHRAQQQPAYPVPCPVPCYACLRRCVLDVVCMTTTGTIVHVAWCAVLAEHRPEASTITRLRVLSRRIVGKYRKPTVSTTSQKFPPLRGPGVMAPCALRRRRAPREGARKSRLDPSKRGS